MNYYIERQNAIARWEIIKEVIETFCSMLRMLDDYKLRDLDELKIGHYTFIGIICDFALDFNIEYDLVSEHFLISEELYKKLLSIIEKVEALGSIKKEMWTVKAVRTESEWKEIIKLAYEIEYMLTVT